MVNLWIISGYGWYMALKKSRRISSYISCGREPPLAAAPLGGARQGGALRRSPSRGRGQFWELWVVPRSLGELSRRFWGSLNGMKGPTRKDVSRIFNIIWYHEFCWMKMMNCDESGWIVMNYNCHELSYMCINIVQSISVTNCHELSCNICEMSSQMWT